MGLHDYHTQAHVDYISADPNPCIITYLHDSKDVLYMVNPQMYQSSGKHMSKSRVKVSDSLFKTSKVVDVEVFDSVVILFTDWQTKISKSVTIKGLDAYYFQLTYRLLYEGKNIYML